MGWRNGECSERRCPTAGPWFGGSNVGRAHVYPEVECAGVGVCDPIRGVCHWDRRYRGEACEYLDCPTDAVGRRCGSHGRCRSRASATATAGWAAQRNFVCECDEGFEGYARERRVCPVATDPDGDDDRTFVCGHRGVCRANEGLCECFTGYGGQSWHLPHDDSCL